MASQGPLQIRLFIVFIGSVWKVKEESQKVVQISGFPRQTIKLQKIRAPE